MSQSLYIHLLPLLVVVVFFKLVLFPVYATGQTLQRLSEALLFFVFACKTIRYISRISGTSWKRQPCSFDFILGNNKQNHKQPQQRSKEVGGPQRCFKQPQIAALTKQLAPTHHDEPTIPGFTIVPEVLNGLPLSDVAKLPGSNVG
jgi:hypothetical protein